MGEIFINNHEAFLRGTLMTILISFVGTIVGLIIGMIIGIVRTTPPSKNKFLNLILKLVKALMNIYVQVLRGTPMIVQASLFFYGLQQYAQIDMSAMTSSFIVVSINTGAYMAEVVRGGINSIDKGQFEASQALGMNHVKTMAFVVLPQAFRNIVPSIGNEFIVNIKDTSVLNVITMSELFFVTKTIVAQNYKYFETYMITSLIYLALTLSIASLLHLLEKKLRGPENYALLDSSDIMKSGN
ncbi:MAG: amino acid ABC transporter permease [Tissierellia bacterium]|nr:amino acid ABC transporter permease [Tissierellia bacterium]